MEWIFGDVIIEGSEDESVEDAFVGIAGDGGSLVEPIAQFFCYLPDAVNNFLQDMFIASQKIRNIDGTYSIKYSPGIIFSGEVPAFDINFIEPKTKNTKTVYRYDDYVKNVLRNNYSVAKSLNNRDKTDLIELQKKPNVFSVSETIILSSNSSTSTDDGLPNHSSGAMSSAPGHDGSSTGTTSTITGRAAAYYWADEENGELKIVCTYPTLAGGSNHLGGATGAPIYYATSVPLNNSSVQAAAKVERKYQSTAEVLQNTIATFYKAMRRIALVGLLSVLVYIGIKILLTSTSAKDKAKYKNMFKDWLIALCLVFTLHYIMSITITLVDKIIEVIKVSSISANGEDILMTSVRNTILNGNSWSQVLAYVVIYCVLTVFTIIYTIQYIRRAIYLAFLTVIAPLITLTYPLDKIKDSKSQAFDMWIKDYIFFTLIQVVHLLIYYVFLGSAIDLTDKGHWLYAIVAIGFITTAEKLIKKMFGFEKSKTLGALAAGATGALVMNAMQKLPKGSSKGSGSGKQSASGNTETKNIRMVSKDPLASLRVAAGANENDVKGGLRTVDSSDEYRGANSSENRTSANSPENRTSANSTESGTNVNTSKGNAWKGAVYVGGKYSAKAIKGAFKGTIGATGAMIGFASGVAQGDISAALKGAAAGGAAGAGLAGAGIKMADNISGGIKDIRNDLEDTWNQGAYGSDIAQSKRVVREFKSSSEYKELRKSSGLPGTEFDEKVQIILDEGITDTKKIGKILKNHKYDPNKYSMENAIKYSKLAEKCTEDILYDQVKFIKFCTDRNLNLTEEELIELRKNIINFK